MGALWAGGEPMTATEVQGVIGAGLAYNTVQTILIRLHEKDLVRRERVGRGHIYWPVEDAATATASRMREMLGDRADRREVLLQFAASLDASDADALRDLLAQTQQKRHR